MDLAPTCARKEQNQLKICLVSQEYPPETGHGGIGTQTYLKAHGLAAMGHDVHVLSHSTDGNEHQTRGGLVTVTRIPGPDTKLEIREESVRWLVHSQNVAAALDDLHREFDFDLIDGPEYGGELFVHLLNREVSSPRVTVHLQGPLIMLSRALGWPAEDSLLFRVGTLMEQTSVQLADAVYSSSATSARWCSEHYGLTGEVPVMHSGIDTDLFRPADVVKPDRPTVIFVGKIGSSKGADLLVDAAISIAHDVPDLHVKLFGTSVGDQAEGLRQKASDAGFPDLVELGGYLSRVDMPMELSRADVFAAPSPYEGGPGFVYLEAMACGLPVIACSGSGIEEIVTHGQNGLLIPPDDVVALTEALTELIAEADEREALGRRARDYARSRMDSKHLVEDIGRFFGSVVRSGAE